MEFLSTYSSIVIVGEGFSPHVFKSSTFVDILGEPDPQMQIILPMLSNQIFPKSGYKVVITPDRIDLGYEKEDILPENLKNLAEDITEKLQQLDAYTCTGIGMNFDVVISDEILGMSGVEYCRKNYLNISDIEKKLGTSEFLANTAKLLYVIDNIKYTVIIEPHFRSKGKNVVMKLNAHQNIERPELLKDALNDYSKIKKYLVDFHDRILEESS